MTAIEFGSLTNGRLCWVAIFSLSQKLCAIRATTNSKLKACVPQSMKLQLKQVIYYKTTKLTTAILLLLQEEVMFRIQKFIFKTAKEYLKRNSPIWCLVANSFAQGAILWGEFRTMKRYSQTNGNSGWKRWKKNLRQWRRIRPVSSSIGPSTQRRFKIAGLCT